MVVAWSFAFQHSMCSLNRATRSTPMHSLPASMETTVNSGSHSSEDTRLHGRWLLIARTAWVGAVILILSVLIASLPVFLAQLQVTCAPATCSFWQLTPAAAQTLQGLGF